MGFVVVVHLRVLWSLVHLRVLWSLVHLRVTSSPEGVVVTSSPEELVSVGGGHLGQTCQGSLVLAVTLLGHMLQDLPELH